MGLWGKGVDAWLNDKKRFKGCSQKNVEYLREFKQISAEQGRVGTVTYFLLLRLHIENARAMMRSAKKQQNLVWVVMQDLKIYRVDPEWEKTFENDIRRMHERCNYVYYICQENLRLTEHWPYFSTVGFDRLLEFQQKYSEKQESVLDVLLPEMEAWEKSHQDEIKAHMETVRHEIEVRDRCAEERKAKAIAEKEAAKAKRREENAEYKEIRENEKKYKARLRRLEKDLDSTIRRAGGYR